MRASLSRLFAAILFVMLGMTIGSGASYAANLDEACGGNPKVTCNSALWCQAAGGQCKAEHADGKCNKAPTFCMRVSRPVCGCNGKTYENDCERQKAKVQLDYVGACPKPPKPAEPAKAPKAKKPKAAKT